MCGPWGLVLLEEMKSVRVEDFQIGIKTDGFEKLEAKLLALGGKGVVAQPEPDLDDLLDRGRVFRRGRKGVGGEPHLCHPTVALHYAEHHALGRGGRREIVTGYGLCRDGFWFQHSWLWDGRGVLDATPEVVRYYGMILTPAEATLFVFANLLATLPGFLDAPLGVP
jgi:hypothetical protein